MRVPFLLENSNTPSPFPPVELALRDPDGLLAVGGDLSVPRLLDAYRHGIFPWYSPGQPILWWSPDPRTVLFPEAMHISRSLRKNLRSGRFTCSFDRDFAGVMRACAAPRGDDAGTWITDAMHVAYQNLNAAGHAHSIEVWAADRLVGGLYGVAIGRVFFGESMFSRVADGSKIALAWLARQLQAWHYAVIDCQVYTGHLQRLGATGIPRTSFIELLDAHCDHPGHPTPWQFDIDPNWR